MRVCAPHISTDDTRVRLLVALTASFLVFGFAARAWADEGLLVLVTEETADETAVDQSFWWQSGAQPIWTPTDLALRDALRAAGAGFAEPADVSSLSKIYRRATPSDANAAAMATVFGRSRALVGTVRYEPTDLRPLGLVGWTAVATLHLVEKTASGADVLRDVELRRARWALSDDEARSGLRAELAVAIAAAVSSGLVHHAGPVGIDSDELMIGIVGPSTRAALDAVRTKLESFAGVTAARERWAAEGIVVVEVNPGVVDPLGSVQQYVSLLTSEGAGRFSVTATESKWPNVVAVHVEERAP